MSQTFDNEELTPAAQNTIKLATEQYRLELIKTTKSLAAARHDLVKIEIDDVEEARRILQKKTTGSKFGAFLEILGGVILGITSNELFELFRSSEPSTSRLTIAALLSIFAMCLIMLGIFRENITSLD